MLKLEAVLEANEETKTLTYESDETLLTIGREIQNHFQLPLTTISRKHCQISKRDGQYFIEDLKSAHGTYLNDQKLEAGEKKPLRNGDVLRLSKATITVSITSDILKRSTGDKTEALAVKAVEDILGKLRQGVEPEESPYVSVTAGLGTGQIFYLKGPLIECVLGRSKECDLVVEDSNASRRHGLIRKDYNGVFYQCLGSKNPTFINGKELPKHAVKSLRDRDEIQIGAVKISFVDPHADLFSELEGIPGFEQTEFVSEDVSQDIARQEASISMQIPAESSSSGPAQTDSAPEAAEAPAQPEAQESQSISAREASSQSQVSQSGSAQKEVSSTQKRAAPKTAVRPKAGFTTLHWVAIGGGVLFFVVIILAVLLS